MGGNAFHFLPSNAFPRIPPAVYQALKARFLPRLQSLYAHVAVPFEAPEKSNHGDLDFVVAGPITGGLVANEDVNVPHDQVREVFGAKHFIPLDGNRTSNFAVPVARGEWSVYGCAKEEAEAWADVGEGGELFYQVDVDVCADQAEWERVVFFHAYGDLGMILGLLAGSYGLVLGTKGLKIPDPPNPPFNLSESFDDILPFLGLSMESWKVGFKTKVEVFEWVSTSRIFDPRTIKTDGPGTRKVKDQRRMYHDFTEWAKTRRGAVEERALTAEDREKAISDALIYFDKKDMFEALAKGRAARARVRDALRGHTVRDWTGLGEYWQGVKMVIDGVREKLGGYEGVLKVLEEDGDEGLKKVVLEIRDELGLLSRDNWEKKVANLAKGTGALVV